MARNSRLRAALLRRTVFASAALRKSSIAWRPIAELIARCVSVIAGARGINEAREHHHHIIAIGFRLAAWRIK